MGVMFWISLVSFANGSRKYQVKCMSKKRLNISTFHFLIIYPSKREREKTSCNIGVCIPAIIYDSTIPSIYLYYQNILIRLSTILLSPLSKIYIRPAYSSGLITAHKSLAVSHACPT